MANSLVRWPVAILFGIAFSLVTVLIGNSSAGYGFPFVWKTGGCPPPGLSFSTACLLAIGFDWIRFGLDVLIYIIVGYMILLAYSKYRVRLRTRAS